jgi:hypothetical protein
VFGTAAAAWASAGWAFWRARTAPCPVEPDAARACLRLRRWSAILYGVALSAFAIGATFAFVLPTIA